MADEIDFLKLIEACGPALASELVLNLSGRACIYVCTLEPDATQSVLVIAADLQINVIQVGDRQAIVVSPKLDKAKVN